MGPQAVPEGAEEGAVVFPEGSTVVRRDVSRGKVWSATPYRVIRDTGNELTLACWPGVEMLAPATWIEWLRTGDADARMQGVSRLAAGRWELGPWVWQDTTVLVRCSAGDFFSVKRLFDATGRGGGWYVVDLALPFARTPLGIDTLDLLVDLVVDADLSDYQWKDEDEYAQARRLGVVDDALHRQVAAAREQVVALVEARQGPFAEDWTSWRRDPTWPLPALPTNALVVTG